MTTDTSDITTRLRQTRADMLGTDDEQHYWDCHEAADQIADLRQAIREGTERSEGTEPVAFGIECDGELLAAYTCEDEESAEAMVERFAASGMTGHVVVPLYRAPKAAWQLVHEVLLLKDAIRRLAEQDATLSVCEGNVTVTMDATLFTEERDSLEWCIANITPLADYAKIHAARLRGLLERLHPKQPQSTLTDAEREAITVACGDSSQWGRPHVATLMRLLERTR